MSKKSDSLLSEYFCVFMDDPAENKPCAVIESFSQAKQFLSSIESKYQIMSYRLWTKGYKPEKKPSGSNKQGEKS